MIEWSRFTPPAQRYNETFISSMNYYQLEHFIQPHRTTCSGCGGERFSVIMHPEKT